MLTEILGPQYHLYFTLTVEFVSNTFCVEQIFVQFIVGWFFAVALFFFTFITTHRTMAVDVTLHCYNLV